MKYTYVSTYINGFKDVIVELLPKFVNDAKIIEHYDGLIIYETNNKECVKKLPFFNNSYLLLGLLKTDKSDSFNTSLKQCILNLKLNFQNIKENLNLNKYKTFKIIATDRNKPTSIDYNFVKPIEDKIKKELKLNIGIKQHDLDFIFNKRDNGLILFMLKLTYNRVTEKTLQKGSLRPELAYFLSYLTEIKSTDIIMDPFCGTAAISRQILKYFKYNMIFLSDNNEEKIQKLKNEYKKNNKNLFIKTRNALNLDYFNDGFINKIITDPPWNEYNKTDENYKLFYFNMLKEFYRILSIGGIAVILMGNSTGEFEQSLKDFKLFNIVNKYNILVNGKKAKVYKLIKI
ncbi:MAG: hypothetical protein E7359_01175 [Clostridiales bacterium]|nr:hypothetical protein [Clostridiales bacterium]